jgi:hypothetical protein
MKDLTKEDLAWIEKFWEEVDLPKPKDYIERAQRVLSGEFTGKRRPTKDRRIGWREDYNS